MKRLPVVILLAALGASCLVPSYAHARTKAQEEARDAQKMQKKQAKAQRKYAKAQKKAERNMLKKQRKYTTYKPKPI